MSIEFENNQSYRTVHEQSTGITGWLISKRIVANKSGANKLLIFVFVISTILSFIFFSNVTNVGNGEGAGIPPEELEEGFLPQS